MEHRSACQRQHRVLGHYIAVQAWLRGLDCIAVERQDLEKYLALERFKSERIKWLLDDLTTVQLGVLVECAVILALSHPAWCKWLPTAAQRIAKIAEDAPKTALFFEPGTGKKRVQEADVVRYLAILDSGLSAPQFGAGTAA